MENAKNTNKQRSMEIASTILAQLGGNKFTVMTGSYNFVAMDNGLVMKLRRNELKAQYLRITLNAMDLYDMEWLKINRKDELVTVAEDENMYNDQIAWRFTERTGLYTSL